MRSASSTKRQALLEGGPSLDESIPSSLAEHLNPSQFLDALPLSQSVTGDPDATTATAMLGRGIRIFDQEPPKRPGDPELNMILVHRFALRREYFRR
jgi:hypothetical protein